MPRGYLDTLSNAKASTWDVYKHQLDDAKPDSEVDGKCRQQDNNLAGPINIFLQEL